MSGLQQILNLFNEEQKADINNQVPGDRGHNLKVMKNIFPQFRKRVFNWAYNLQETSGKEWPVCLAKAWALYRLRKRLAAGPVRFSFEKADGSLRITTGTLKDSNDMIKGTGKTNYKAMRYVDVETGSFKSFQIDKFITAYD